MKWIGALLLVIGLVTITWGIVKNPAASFEDGSFMLVVIAWIVGGVVAAIGLAVAIFG